MAKKNAFATYYQEGAERAERVRRLFTRIARRYDLINDLQSIGLHRLWKRRLISTLHLRPGDRVLDLACGSGDLAYRVLQKQPTTRVIGGDFTFPMLRVAQIRSQESGIKIQNPQSKIHPNGSIWTRLPCRFLMAFSMGW